MFEKRQELDPKEWEQLIKQDEIEIQESENGIDSPLGLNEETKSNLTFMILIIIGALITFLLGGSWYYMR